MPVTINNFTYTNSNSGRTRVNEQGLIVGVDFSDTSNTIATGPKTFTLTATANLNRDYSVGEAVVAVAQAGATGSLIGTVTSYTPSTQVIIIEVASITGSGTGTDWRIGSTAFRKNTYDPVTMENKGQLVEGGATNLHLGSSDFTSPNFALTEMSVTANTTVAPDGTSTADKLVPSTNNILHYVNKSASATVGLVYTHSVFAKAAEETVLAMRDNTNGATSLFDLVSGTATSGNANIVARISAAGAGWFRCSISFVTGIGNIDTRITPRSYTAFAGDGTSGLFVWGSQVEQSSAPSSYIPTTTVSVSRAADQLSVGGTNFSQFYNSAQGTLVMELTPIAQAVGAVAGSLNDGTLNNAIRIQQKQSGTLSSIRKMATDGVTDVMAVNATTNNTLRSNGVDYTEVATQSANAQLGVATSSLGNFLSVGATENFRNSADSGLTYNARTIGGTFGGAHFGIGRFVIAGVTAVIGGATVGCVAVSTDGLAFRRVNIPGLTQGLNEITSNGTNQYVAVGNGGVIYTSPDAETWTAQTSGTTQALLGADYGSIGGTPYYYTAGTGNQSVRRSTNGTAWTQMTVDNVGYTDIAIGNGQIVLCRDGGNGYSSLDGTTFTVNASLGNVAGAVYSAALGLWIAVGPTGRIVTATDPSGTWTVQTSGSTANLREVQLFGSTIVVVGDGQTVLTSTNATSWTSRTAGVTSTLNGIATNGSRLLICGTSGAITTSEDGTTFTSRTGNAATLNGAAFGNGTYVVVGNSANGSGLIATVNPTTFEYQRRVSGVTSSITNVRFINGAFYAGTNAVNQVLRSTDGTSWSLITATGGNTVSVEGGFAFSGSNYVGVGPLGRYVISSDGLVFTNASSAVTSQTLNGVDFTNNLFVAVGNAGTIITSPNGTTWTLRTSGVTSTLQSVMYSTRDNQWYAAGDNGVILRSADAITWTSIANDATVGIFTAGALQANPLAGKFIPNVKNRVAIGWTSTGGVSISINGGDVVTDPSVTMPVLTQYSVGMNGLSGQHWNSTIKTQRAYRVRVSDDELKALSRI